MCIFCTPYCQQLELPLLDFFEFSFELDVFMVETFSTYGMSRSNTNFLSRLLGALRPSY